jgi:hypothetical protein
MTSPLAYYGTDLLTDVKHFMFETPMFRPIKAIY